MTPPDPAAYGAGVTRAASECDVLVIGAGPAGCTAAHLLASWGHAVTIVHRSPTARVTLAESLPPSIRKLLRFLGLLDHVDAAGLYPNTGNIIRWAGGARSTTTRDAGYHVRRAQFDAVLLDAARASSARLVAAVAQHVDQGDPVEVICKSGRKTFAVRARYVLDCSGRAGVVARHGLRRSSAAYRTLAIAADWDCPAWPAADATATTVESYEDGWAWSVPLDARRRQCTVMIDPKDSRPLFRVYDRELAKATLVSDRLTGARRVSSPWTCDASVYDAVRAADGRCLLVGDAASFIEPLSSAGVKKSLLSAWRAAVVVNTCLTNSSMAAAALDLFVRREHEVHEECRRRSAAFFADAAAFHHTGFWSARTGESAGADADTRVDVRAVHGATAAAFERLRAARVIRLRPNIALQFVSVAAIDGRDVVMREAVLGPASAVPLPFAEGVDLAVLARVAAAAGDVESTIAAYQDRVGPVELPELLKGLSLLVARSVLTLES